MSYTATVADVKSVAVKIATATREYDGASIDIAGRNYVGSPLYAVSIYPDRGLIVDGDVDEADVEDFIYANLDILESNGAFVGTWVHEGQTYLDISVAVDGLEAALSFARDHNQLAIFDLSRLEEIPVEHSSEVAA